MKVFSLLFVFAWFSSVMLAQTYRTGNYVSEDKGKDYFLLSSPKTTAPFVVDSDDYYGVTRALSDLQNDVFRVTGNKPELNMDAAPKAKEVVIVGTLGKSALINDLAARNIIDGSELEGKWEKFIIKTVKNPYPGVESALIIAGSDKRGTIFGIYDVSEQIGVSPWHFWADAPVKKKERIYIKPGSYSDGEPAVKYRGIFINDESPAFRYWAFETFGGINHQCYETIFELLLRSKANFLWPSMWLPTMFNVDDPLNPKRADDYGIVMSTSHHEPMMRAHNEWGLFGEGDWNYQTNEARLQDFWREGIERMGSYESIVTIGMRGDGDHGMAEETAVDLLQQIVKDQREIIADVTGKPASETPQVWAIYKEVQDYYDKGMRVDDDITIMFADDNWGNIRYLPKKEDPVHPGGYGMYYHFDYVGAPVSYRWLNVTQIERVWEQMKLTYAHGVDEIWVVNVGDIKPMEFPISFFMDLAWNPDAMKAEDLPGYYENWAQRIFGQEHHEEIAKLLSLSTKYNARRTHEMMKPDTYSIENYREADRMLEDYKPLVEESQRLYALMPQSHKSAFYQLVLSPIELTYNLYEMYVSAGKNKLFAEQGRASANLYAARVIELFEKDAELTRQFHEDLEDGKWKHMMSQTHMGYTSWNHPRANVMPAVSYVQLKDSPQLGFEIEHGPQPSWGGFSVEADPLFSNSFTNFDPYNRQSYYIDLYNMGKGTISYEIEADAPWIILSKSKGSIAYDEKVYVSIAWDKVPKEDVVGEIRIKGGGKEYSVRVPVRNVLPKAAGFVENNGVVAMEAANYSRKKDGDLHHWTTVPNLGRTYSSLILEPFNSGRKSDGKTPPVVEYDFTVFDAGEVTVEAYLSPIQDYKKEGGLKFAVSINDEAPQIVNINEGELVPDYEYADWWMQSVGDRIKIKRTKHQIADPGLHTLKIWMIDTGIVFQKFVIDAGGHRKSYLGAPESKYIK